MTGEIFYPTFISPQRVIGQRTFDFSRQVIIVAIIDLGSISDAIASIERAVAYGVDWLNISAVPVGTSAAEGSDREELAYLIAVIEATRDRTDAVVSVEADSVEVARHALAAGADVINSVTGLHDPVVTDAVAEAGAHLIITHNPVPSRALAHAEYDDIAREVAKFLRERADMAIRRGVPTSRIILDPGHDVSKDRSQSLELTRGLTEITKIGYPVLVAASSTYMLDGAADLSQEDGIESTVATLSICILQGARLIRVRNVHEAGPAVQMVEAVLGWRSPGDLG